MQLDTNVASPSFASKAALNRHQQQWRSAQLPFAWHLHPTGQLAWMPGVLRMCSGLLARAMPPCTASSRVRRQGEWAAGTAVQAG